MDVFFKNKSVLVKQIYDRLRSQADSQGRIGYETQLAWPQFSLALAVTLIDAGEAPPSKNDLLNALEYLVHLGLLKCCFHPKAPLEKVYFVIKGQKNFKTPHSQSRWIKDNFYPSLNTRQQAARLGLMGAGFYQCIDAFIYYHQARRTLSEDFDRLFLIWLQRKKFKLKKFKQAHATQVSFCDRRTRKVQTMRTVLDLKVPPVS